MSRSEAQMRQVLAGEAIWGTEKNQQRAIDRGFSIVVLWAARFKFPEPRFSVLQRLKKHKPHRDDGPILVEKRNHFQDLRERTKCPTKDELAKNRRH